MHWQVHIMVVKIFVVKSEMNVFLWSANFLLFWVKYLEIKSVKLGPNSMEMKI
jgi:hypothetical protein